MKNHLLLLTVFCLLAIGQTSAYPSDIAKQPTTTVVKIESVTAEQHMSIYTLFANDQDYKVVNSCEVLGLYVIDALDGDLISPGQAKLYIQSKLEQAGLKKDSEFVQGKSKVDILLDCRAKMQEIHDPQGSR